VFGTASLRQFAANDGKKDETERPSHIKQMSEEHIVYDWPRPPKAVVSPQERMNNYEPNPDPDSPMNVMTRSGMKDYKVREEWRKYDEKAPHLPFHPKEEFTRIAFDPAVRHRLPTMPNDLIYRAMTETHLPPRFPPQSAYVAIHRNGQTYHLFNAAKFPLGRMAELISRYIRGRHKPGYDHKMTDRGDVCVVINAADPLLKGRKRFLKVYRHHTGYPGGLKEVQMKHVLEKEPERVIIQAVK